MIRRRAGLPALLCAALGAGCGVRGDPLPPRLVVPAPVADLSAERFGDHVYVQFTIPSANSDGTSPADLDRVELYALTAPPPAGRPDVALDAWLAAAMLVARLEVARPGADRASAGDDRLPAQGERLTVAEALPLPTPAVNAGEDPPERPAVVAGPLLGPPLPRPATRTYVALAVSGRDRESRPSRRAMVPLGSAPAPPAPPRVTYDETRLSVAWTPPPAARLPVQRTATAAELPSRALPPRPAATRYEVYATAAAPDAGRARVPRPLHAAPLAGTSYHEADPALGVERCFAVRTVHAIDGIDVRSAPSGVTCRELVDTFAPAPPAGLAAVAAAGVVNLAWMPNAEDDVVGYLVLRARGAGAKLGALTAEPIAATTWRDATVEPGVSYEYAVQAVDDGEPPNVSPPSERVREQAR